MVSVVLMEGETKRLVVGFTAAGRFLFTIPKQVVAHLAYGVMVG